MTDHSALIERLEGIATDNRDTLHPITLAAIQEAAAALRDQQELIAATRAYFNGWMQDEAEDGAPEWVGCSVEQHEAARRVRDALPSAPDQAKALK